MYLPDVCFAVERPAAYETAVGAEGTAHKVRACRLVSKVLADWVQKRKWRIKMDENIWKMEKEEVNMI